MTWRQFGYWTLTVGVFLLVNAFVSVATPWHAADRAYITARPAAATVQAREAEMSDRLAAMMTARRCTPPARWRAVHTGIPATMILKTDGTFTLTAAAWTYPAPVGYWVMAVCAR